MQNTKVRGGMHTTIIDRECAPQKYAYVVLYMCVTNVICDTLHSLWFAYHPTTKID